MPEEDKCKCGSKPKVHSKPSMKECDLNEMYNHLKDIHDESGEDVTARITNLEALISRAVSEVSELRDMVSVKDGARPRRSGIVTLDIEENRIALASDTDSSVESLQAEVEVIDAFEQASELLNTHIGNLKVKYIQSHPEVVIIKEEKI